MAGELNCFWRDFVRRQTVSGNRSRDGRDRDLGCA